MRLVSDWRESIRWNSMRVLAAIAALPLLWEQLPPETMALIPADWRPYIITVMAVCGMLARVIKQPSLPE